MIVMRRAPGVVTSVDDEGLFHMAVEHRLTVAFLHHVGDFVPEGAPLMAVWSRSPTPVPDDPPEGRLAGTVEIGPDRTMTQDAAFGFRQIVDIAEKALSPAVNDPTTALQALDQVHDLLRRLATRRFPSPFRLDEAGEIAYPFPPAGWTTWPWRSTRSANTASDRSADRAPGSATCSWTFGRGAAVATGRWIDSSGTSTRGSPRRLRSPTMGSAAARPSASGQGPG